MLSVWIEKNFRPADLLNGQPGTGYRVQSNTVWYCLIFSSSSTMSQKIDKSFKTRAERYWKVREHQRISSINQRISSISASTASVHQQHQCISASAASAHQQHQHISTDDCWLYDITDYFCKITKMFSVDVSCLGPRCAIVINIINITIS